MHAQPTRADMASAPTPATGSRAGAPPGQADAKPRPGPGDQRQRIPRPLPDPTAIRLCAVPDSAPPYDTDTGDGGGTAGGADLVRPDPGTPVCAASRPATATAGEGKPGTRPAPGPGSGEWPSRFAQVLAETLAGARPPAQLRPWTTERARSQIRRLGPLLTARQRPVIQRIITSLPAAGVMEMSVVVGLGPRVRGLAVRLEQAEPPPSADGRPGEGRWLCTAVEAA